MYSPWVLSAWVALKEKGIPFSVTKARSNERRAPDRGNTEGRLWWRRFRRLPSVIFGYQNHRQSWSTWKKKFPATKYPSLFPPSAEERAKDREIVSWLRKRFDRVEEIDVLRRHFQRAEKPVLNDKIKPNSEKLVHVA